MATLGAVAAGAAAGGLIGAIVGMGSPELESKTYDGTLSNGDILIAAHIDDRDQKKRVKTLFDEHGATDVTTNTEAPRAQALERSAGTTLEPTTTHDCQGD